MTDGGWYSYAVAEPQDDIGLNEWGSIMMDPAIVGEPAIPHRAPCVLIPYFQLLEVEYTC